MEHLPAPTGTRADLINAALRLFGRDGYAATSTRALAAEAGTNIASIAYHFGGKEALRLACGEEVMRRIGAIANPPEIPADLPPPAATAMLEEMLRSFVGFLTRSPEAAATVGFLLRELAEDGPVLEMIYDQFFARTHVALCRLCAAATGGDADTEEVRLLVFSLLGQAIYFRVGAPLIQRRMGWAGYSKEESRAIADRLVANLHAILRDASCRSPSAPSR